jgi:hypothetical protein
MAITIESFVLDGVTIGTTEYSVPFNANYAIGTNKTDDGVFQLFVDDNANMTKTEEYEIRIREKVHNGGTQRTVFRATIKGVQSEVFVTPTLLLGNGWDMTIKKLAGTDRAFDARISQVA